MITGSEKRDLAFCMSSLSLLDLRSLIPSAFLSVDLSICKVRQDDL